MKIRKATVEDAATVASILKSVEWLWATQEPLEELEAETRRFLEAISSSPASAILVADAGAGPLGFVAFHFFPAIRGESEGYVSHLFVHSEARGRGIGRALLAAAEQEATAHRCKRLLLYINRPRPAYQRGFYEKAGWVERDTAALFFRSVGEGK